MAGGRTLGEQAQEERAHKGVKALLGRCVCGKAAIGRIFLDCEFVAVVEHRFIKRILVVEVVVHGSHVGASELADFADGGLGEASRGKDFRGGFKHALASGDVGGSHSSSSMKHVFETCNRKTAGLRYGVRGTRCDLPRTATANRAPVEAAQNFMKPVPSACVKSINCACAHKGLAKPAFTVTLWPRSMNNQVLTSQSVGPGESAAQPRETISEADDYFCNAGQVCAVVAFLGTARGARRTGEANNKFLERVHMRNLRFFQLLQTCSSCRLSGWPGALRPALRAGRHGPAGHRKGRQGQDGVSGVQLIQLAAEPARYGPRHQERGRAGHGFTYPEPVQIKEPKAFEGKFKDSKDPTAEGMTPGKPAQGSQGNGRRSGCTVHGRNRGHGHEGSRPDQGRGADQGRPGSGGFQER